ncbi:hypothetical protein B0H14DRAFT_3603594 [Mycena olivaceomarginata]|nr:hypothetical protein B0H14DRAFT_3603594 [Mycena olivaceomarginata]
MSASQSPSTTQPPATPTDPHPDVLSGNPHPDTSSPDPRPDAPSPDPLPDAPSLSPPAPAIVTAVKVKPARHQKGAPKSHPGKQSWVWGTKFVFFSKRKEKWLREFKAKRSGVFYSKMAKLYIKKYRRHLTDDQDLEFDIPDPTNDAADEVVHEVLDEAKEKFLNWGVESFKELFIGVLDGVPPKPQRGRIVHFYSRKYYETCVKARVESRLESLRRHAKMSGEDMLRTIEVVAKVTNECFEEENVAFQKEVEVAYAKEYQLSLKAWEASLADSPTRTPEEIAATLENAAFYLQTLRRRYSAALWDVRDCLACWTNWLAAVGGGEHAPPVGSAPTPTGTGSAVGSWVQTSDMGMEDREGEQRGQRESTPKENEECGRCPVEIYNQHWQRDDRAKWTEELSRCDKDRGVGIEMYMIRIDCNQRWRYDGYRTDEDTDVVRTIVETIGLGGADGDLNLVASLRACFLQSDARENGDPNRGSLDV